MKIFCRWIALTLLLFLSPSTLSIFAADETAPGPSVLVCTPKGLGQSFVDLEWLREFHEAGFEPDYLDTFSQMTWDRVRQYDVIVIFGSPGDGTEIPFFFPKSGSPDRNQYIAIIERFLESGGGVFAMIYTDSGDKDVQQLIEPWGARLPVEFYRETEEKKIVPLPRMDMVMLSLVDQVMPSPVTKGVKNLWLPYGEYYHGSLSGPIAVSEDWTVIVKGTKTSHSEPVVTADHFINTRQHPDPFVRPGGVPEPDLMAIRSYKNGRILLCTQSPAFSIGQGTKWLYGRRCLSKGLNRIPSDYERLLQKHSDGFQNRQ